MKRDLATLAAGEYDLLIVGGGIYGATLVWEAAQRGLKVALVEKEDFCAATSANSLKIIHGGLRYLQHLDIARVRESMRERRALMRIAPHLVHPLPTIVPTYGHGMKSREVMALALLVNDILGVDRNQGLYDPSKHIPRGQTVGRDECLRMVPGIDTDGLTGGAVYYDAQVYNSERLPLAFILSAAEQGAQIANYAEATGLLREGDKVVGAQVTDRLTGDVLDVRARMVVNVAGPWVNRVLRLVEDEPTEPVKLSKAVNVITRSLFDEYAVGISSRDAYTDQDAVIDKGSRLFFVAPWRGTSIIGTDYAPYEGDPDDFCIMREDVQVFLNAFNKAYPATELTPEDVTFVHGGLLPMKDVNEQTGSVRLVKHFSIRDHGQDGAPGAMTVIGVKYTTARDVAKRTVDRLLKMWGESPIESASTVAPLYGGDIERFDVFLAETIRENPLGAGEAAARRLAYNYGAAVSDVLAHAEGETGEQAVLKAEVRHAVREEMAQRLTDVILRRTEFGTAGYPGADTLQTCAAIMAEELRWDAARTQQEIEHVNAAYPDWVVEREAELGTELADPII